ncbi:hypothetical protein HY988_02690 [Candidatus Micrarchaeota archaeon]|nr:hypothetical protein [Candidatus Micrarchaeota archaeon]
MSEETIKIIASRKKPLKPLASLFGSLGFSKISYSENALSVEKIKGEDLKGKPYVEYSIVFKPDSIDLTYSLPPNKNRVSRLVELIPTFLDVLQVAEDYYAIKPSSIYFQINSVLAQASKIIDREAVEFSSQLTDLQTKYNDLSAKYNDLVRSSEANTRILLESEQKADELRKRISKLSGMSDELLKQTLYEWVKIHGGTIDIKEFAKANSLSPSRAEEGLNQLIQEGYIKRIYL